MSSPRWSRTGRGLLFAGLLAATACATSRAPLHPQSPSGRWHVVASGETAELLAKQGGVPVEDFLEVNGLERADEVRPGALVFVLEPTRPAALDPHPERESPGRGPASAPTGPATTTLAWPLANPRISSPFGARWGRAHEGIDLVASPGTPVWAAADGVVAYAGHGIRGYGNLIVVEHTGGVLTVYAHNSVLSARKGERVRRGQVIALSGQSGRATAPHLHFEVRRGESPIDPMPFLPSLNRVSEREKP